VSFHSLNNYYFVAFEGNFATTPYDVLGNLSVIKSTTFKVGHYGVFAFEIERTSVKATVYRLV
jgi:hypothetical protein